MENEIVPTGMQGGNRLPVDPEILMLLAKALLESVPFAALAFDLFSYSAKIIGEDQQKVYLRDLSDKIEELRTSDSRLEAVLDAALKSETRYRSLAHFSMMRIAEEGADAEYVTILRNMTINIPLMDVNELVRQDLEHALRTLRPIHFWVLRQIHAYWDENSRNEPGNRRVDGTTHGHALAKFLLEKKSGYPYFRKIITDLQTAGAIQDIVDANDYAGDYVEPSEILSFGEDLLKALGDPSKTLSGEQILRNRRTSQAYAPAPSGPMTRTTV